MDRTTSFAKSVEGLHHEPSALDRVKDLTVRIAMWFQPEPERPRAPERVQEGSRMVQADAPALRPTPSGPLRWGVDRQSAYTRLAAERKQERRKIRKAELKHDFSQRTAPTRDRGAGRGR